MGTIRKRGKTYQIDYFDPGGKRIRKSFKKKKDAAAELGKRVSLMAEGRYLDVKKEYTTTLAEVLAEYEKNFKDQPSYKRAKRFFVEEIREYFSAETLLANIRYLDLETFRNHLRQRTTQHGTFLSDASVNRATSCLRHIFSKAKEWEMIEQNPFDKGKSLILKENNKRLRFLSEAEIKSLMAACNDPLRDIVEMAINTGMRKGEILPLKWDQVRNGFIYLKETKTKEPRQIPVNDVLDALFKQIRIKEHLSSKYVFTYRGKRIDSVKTAFNAAVKRAGIVDFRFHDLRHTFASQLLLKGGTLKDVQELLGHKTMTMTLRYAHLTQEHKRKAVNLLNGLTGTKKATVTNCHKTEISVNAG
jgi:integrase